jgi:hypothetical protein
MELTFSCGIWICIFKEWISRLIACAKSKVIEILKCRYVTWCKLFCSYLRTILAEAEDVYEHYPNYCRSELGTVCCENIAFLYDGAVFAVMCVYIIGQCLGSSLTSQDCCNGHTSAFSLISVAIFESSLRYVNEVTRNGENVCAHPHVQSPKILDESVWNLALCAFCTECCWVNLVSAPYLFGDPVLLLYIRFKVKFYTCSKRNVDRTKDYT